jgi:hypothetical protein
MTNETHISEEQLVLLYYGEAADAAPIESHLSECEQCRAEYRAVQTVLNTVDSAPVPERGADYGSAVWKRIERRAGARSRGLGSVLRLPRWFGWWMWAPVAAGLLVLAFFAGRISRRPEAPTTIASGQVRERILLVAVGDHLERSQMVLAEISNAPSGKGKIDISDEQRMAEDLLDSNRLYRQTANSTGEKGMANVLDDLERMLLEIANGPSQLDPAQLNELRQEIEDRGLLFKIRVIGSKVQHEEMSQQEETAPAPKQNTKQGKQL